MPNCTYCGKPAGLLRTSHAECRAQFDRATATIPAFFEKLLQSLLPADRFDRLLKEVAATFHISSEQLRSLSITGINAMLDAALAQHLPTIEDEHRILEVSGALGISSAEVPGLEDKLVKISMLRDLDDEKIPDHVTVVGPMPFELEPDETIVWIFNGVKNYRTPKSKEPAPPRAPSPLRPDMPDYFPPASLGNQSARTSDLVEVGVGDLMITNRHIFIVSDERHRKIPLSKVGGFDTFSDGFHISRSATDERPLTFIVDDPWFAANLIVRLLRLPSNVKAARQADPADAS
jgi:hypothetical protein